MAKYQRPRGTEDVLPAQSPKWQWLEAQMRHTALAYGYGEIRMPTFESTEVFARGVGDTTDIVSKEMYTFEDKGGRSVTLRPEGTSGVVRAVLEHGLLASAPLPLKSYYIQSCFRYEKNQKGRLREFHQFGIECFGTHEATADVEVMAVADSLMRQLDIRQFVTLEINSIGCPKCRPAYNASLKAYFEGHREELCPTCQERLEKNPMRILDCKSEVCSAIAKDAPVMLDSLCGDCAEHFEETKNLLQEAGMEYIINPRIVRGLDYYTNTVFEFIAEGVGTQGTVCAGGRYDGLISEMGGQPTPAVGYGMGIERMLMLLEEQGKIPELTPKPTVYMVGLGDAGKKAARKATRELRNAGLYTECDIANRSLKAQMKAAGRLGAEYTVVVGDDEAASGKAKLKHMADGEQRDIQLEDIQLAVYQWQTELAGAASAMGVIGSIEGTTTIVIAEDKKGE